MLAAIAAAACSDRESSIPAATVRDSVGVRIVELSVEALDAASAWTATLVAQIDDAAVGTGRVDGGLFRVRSAGWLSTGEIVVANAGSKQILVFSPAGQFVRAVGRAGNGPGEFSELAWAVATPGDSILAYDLRTERFTVFAPSGEVSRTFRLAARTVQLPFARQRLSDGSILVVAEPVFTAATPQGVHRDTTKLFRFSDTGQELGVITTVPGASRFVLVDRGGTSAIELGYGNALEVSANDSVLLVGMGDRYEIREYSLSGKLRGIIRAPVKPRPVTPEMIDAFKARLNEEPDRMWRAFNQRMTESMPFPATAPAHSRVHAARTGDMWVRDYPAFADTSVRWLIFDREGGLRAHIVLPRDLTIYDVTESDVLGVWRDDVGQETVRSYRLTPASR